MTRICVLLAVLSTAAVSGYLYTQLPQTSTAGETKAAENNKIATLEVLKPAKEVKLAKNVYLQVFKDGNRRVVVDSYVLPDTDALEQLLTRKGQKEHEAVLAADVDARKIHEALILAKATEGRPVVYDPYKPATGTKIKVLLQYKNKGKAVVVPAQSWVYNLKTKKTMKYQAWVFAGSRFFPPQNKGEKPIYAANDGDVICVANFDTALLDLPVRLPKDNSELVFRSNRKVMPPVNTKVRVILQPVLQKTKKKAEEKKQSK